jgi:hypothetical protein
MWPSVKKKKNIRNKEEGGYRQNDEKEKTYGTGWQQSKGNATDNNNNTRAT